VAESEGLGKGMEALGSAITSPAKLAFAGFVLLAYKGCFTIHLWEFLVIAGIFFGMQVLHDDCARILLNSWAQRRDILERRKLGIP
jgi:hypothetical protein